MFAVLILCLLSTPSCQGQVFDMVECNHYYDDDELVILYSWNHQYRRWHVERYYLLDEDDPLLHLPVKVGEMWAMTIRDGSRMYARMYRETYTNHDPEVWNKRVYGESHRVGLPCR